MRDWEITGEKKRDVKEKYLEFKEDNKIKKHCLHFFILLFSYLLCLFSLMFTWEELKKEPDNATVDIEGKEVKKNMDGT